MAAPAAYDAVEANMNLGPKFRQVDHLRPVIPFDPAALFEWRPENRSGCVRFGMDVSKLDVILAMLRSTCRFRAIGFREKTWQERNVRPSPRYFLGEGTGVRALEVT